jgi:peptidoglycan/xylan/chitin deacetylase (PgdA/CDA1 family)
MAGRRISLAALTSGRRTAVITMTAALALIITVVTASLVSGSGSDVAHAASPTADQGKSSSASPKPHTTTPRTPAVPAVPDSIQHQAEAPGRAVNITIDDGPDPVWTPKVLEVLKRFHVHATFCMIGPQAKANPALVRRVVAEGHRLCDHTVSHDESMDHKPFAYQKKEILDAQDMITTAAGGTHVQYYRAPGGAFTPASRALAAQHGMRPLGWNIDTKDFSRPGVATIISTLKYEIGNGPTILFHDGGGDRTQTVAALKQALPWLAQQGYAFSFPKVK